ncbi:MAG: Uma2 family endonuclease [Thermomicrobiales bacterium]
MAIETQPRISEEAYERLALDELDRKWELRDGYLLEKPGMTAPHNYFAVKLGHMLMTQLDWSEFEVRIDTARVHRPGATYFIPDVVVVPTALVTSLFDRHGVLEVYDEPLPLVAEVWSRSTGDYDVKEKLAAYQQRGDLEIWFIHPYERTVTARRRQPDGTYGETMHREGIIRPVALPGVEIDLSALLSR